MAPLTPCAGAVLVRLARGSEVRVQPRAGERACVRRRKGRGAWNAAVEPSAALPSTAHAQASTAAAIPRAAQPAPIAFGLQGSWARNGAVEGEKNKKLHGSRAEMAGVKPSLRFRAACCAAVMRRCGRRRAAWRVGMPSRVLTCVGVLPSKRRTFQAGYVS